MLLCSISVTPFLRVLPFPPYASVTDIPLPPSPPSPASPPSPLWSLLPGNRLEIAVHLLPIGRRRGIVGARCQPIPCLFRLQFFRQRRLGAVEGLGGLPLQVLPFREVLLERLGSRRRHRHAASLEREACAALGERLV